jgi:hypothetical protein
LYVEKLAAHLQSAGMTVWYDCELSASDRFDAEIEQQILTCAASVVVLTPASARSEWVLLEPCTGPILLQGVIATMSRAANYHQLDSWTGSVI